MRTYRQAADERVTSIRRTVLAYCQYAPNSHLGESTRREDIKHAFFVIRSWLNNGCNFEQALGKLDDAAYSMMDM